MMWNERQRLIRNNQENAETWRKNQLKKDSEKKNISETVIRKKILVKTVIRKNISERMLKKWKKQMLPERGDGCRCKGKTPKTFS